MATESGVWWTTQYTSFSIKDLQALPIFNKFVGQHYPFKREEATSKETFTIEAGVEALEWTHKIKDEGEKFTHERETDTWFYERRYYKGEVHYTSRTWLSADSEWGEVVRRFSEYSIHELWKLRGSDRRYERFILEEDEKRGIRTGTIPALEGLESWTETYWQRGEESESEKIWSRPDAQGGENQHKRGPYWWGEVWHDADDKKERKMWHTEGDHDWGHLMGHSAGKEWNEKWDITKDTRKEERLTRDGDRHRGFRYIRDRLDWYRQEWDGLVLLGIDEGVEIAKKQNFVQHLDEVLVSAHDTVLKGEHTLELLLREAQEFEDEVEAIKLERKNIPKPDSNNADALFASIRVERELADKQERLKQRMINSCHSDHGMYYQFHILLDRLLKASLTSYKTIAEALKHDTGVAQDCEKWVLTADQQKRRRNVGSYDRDLMYYNSLAAMEREKDEHLHKFVGGMERKEVQKTMNSLYEIMVRHDAVSDKIIDLVRDSELKEKLDGFERNFEDIHSGYLAGGDPDKLLENLTLFKDYQPIHLHLVGRLRGYGKSEVSTELTSIDGEMESSKGTASLIKVRNKVRSGRGARDSPFQLIDRDINKVIPFVLAVDKVMKNVLESSNSSLASGLKMSLERTVDKGEPFEILVEKAAMLAEAVALIDIAKIEEIVKTIEELQIEVSDLEEIITHKSTEVSELTVRLDEKENYNRELELLLFQKDAYVSELKASMGAEVSTLISNVQRLKSQLDATTEEKLFMETRVEELEVVQISMQSLQEEVEYLKELVSQHEETISESRLHYDSMKTELNAEIDRKQTLYEEKDAENTHWLLVVKQLKTDLNEWKLRYEQLYPEAEENKAKVKELEAFKLNALSFEGENARLKEMIEQLHQLQGERGMQYEDILSNLNDKLTELQSVITSKEDEIEGRKKERERLIAMRHRQLMLRILFIITNVLKAERINTFLSWKLQSVIPPEIVSEDIMITVPEVKSTLQEDEEEWSSADLPRYTEAEEASTCYRKHWLEASSVFRHLRADLVRFDTPLNPVLCYGLAEEFMEKKLESDNSDLQAGRRPGYFSDFILDYMFKTRNGKRIAQREFSKFVPALYNQFQACIPLAWVIARLMHIFHHNPASLEASILVLRFNKAFQPLSEKYEGSRANRGLPVMNEAERKITGGISALYDLLDAFFGVFEVDKVFLWHFLRHIKPTKVTISEYVCAVISWFCTKKKSIATGQIWALLDPSASNSISRSDFIAAINSGVCLGLSPRILKEAFDNLVPTESLSKETFEAKLAAVDQFTPEDLMVTKGGFLTAVLEAYSARLRRNAVLLREQFRANGIESVDADGVATLVKEHHSDLHGMVVARLVEAATKWSKEHPIDIVGYPSALLAYPAGCLSKPPLQVPELNGSTEEHHFEYDLLSGNKAVTTKITTTQITSRTSRITRTTLGRKA